MLCRAVPAFPCVLNVRVSSQVPWIFPKIYRQIAFWDYFWPLLFGKTPCNLICKRILTKKLSWKKLSLPLNLAKTLISHVYAVKTTNLSLRLKKSQRPKSRNLVWIYNLPLIFWHFLHVLAVRWHYKDIGQSVRKHKSWKHFSKALTSASV